MRQSINDVKGIPAMRLFTISVFDDRDSWLESAVSDSSDIESNAGDERQRTAELSLDLVRSTLALAGFDSLLD